MTKRLLAMGLALLVAACASGPKPEGDRHKLATIHYRLGVDALQKGLLPRAFSELLEANKLEPNRPDVLDALALAWWARGDLDKAELYFRKAIRHGAGASTHTNYASLLNRLGRYEEARREAERAIADPRYPNQHLALIDLGDALFGEKRYEEALSAYRQAASFAPGDPRPKIREARVLAVTGKRNFARAMLLSTGRRFLPRRDVVGMVVDELARIGAVPEAKTLLAAFIDQAKTDEDRAWAKDKLLEVIGKTR